MMEQLGDYYRVKGVAEQPLVEFGEDGLLYYWFEVFRRASVTRENCVWLISIDVYAQVENLPYPCEEFLTLQDIRLHHCDVTPLLKNVDESIQRVVLEVVEYKGKRELISLIVTLCCLAEPPSYDLVEKLYIQAVRLIEKRCPLSNPLWVDVDELMRYKERAS